MRTRSELEVPNWAEKKPSSADAESFVRRLAARRDGDKLPDDSLVRFALFFFFLRNIVIDAALYVLFHSLVFFW